MSHPNENAQKLSGILSRVLSIALETITDATAPENTATWDSYNALMLVSELETAFAVSFTMEEVIAVKNVGDIKAALRRHGVTIDDV